MHGIEVLHLREAPPLTFETMPRWGTPACHGHRKSLDDRSSLAEAGAISR
jgi:hypothetical protein